MMNVGMVFCQCGRIININSGDYSVCDVDGKAYCVECLEAHAKICAPCGECCG
jgi:hypothetical protein